MVVPTPKPTPTRVLAMSSSQRALTGLRPLLADAGYTPLYFHLVEDLLLGPVEPRIQIVVETYQPDLLLLDIPFGEEPAGWQLVQTLQLSPMTAALPLVVCVAASAYVHELGSHLYTHGIRLILKPFVRDEVFNGLRAARPSRHAGTLQPPPDQAQDLHAGVEVSEQVSEQLPLHAG